MLRKLHMVACLQCLQVDLRDKSVKLSFCPFCTYMGGGGGRNDLSYLNHIIIVHYNTSYGCGKCLKQAFISSSTLHIHKKVCIWFITKKPTTGSDGKPSSGGGGDGNHGGSTRATPRRTPRLLPQNPRAPVPHLPCRHHHTAVDKSHPTTTSLPRTGRTLQVTRRRRRRMQVLPGRAPATRCARTVAATRPTSARSAAVSPMSLYFVNKIFHCKTCVSVMI